jgi:sarcosine oxidase gamma subunit
MWLFTKQGFYSVVAKSEGEWHVRARTRKDLENLNRLAGTKHPIHRSDGADYRWRIVLPGEEARALIAKLAADIDYANFKGVVARTPDQRDKLSILHEIWELMYRYQTEREER